MVPLIAAVVYHGGELFNVYAFLLSIFTLTILRAGYRQYVILKNSISLKETFETIYEKSPDGIALIKNNRFKDCNESIVQMFQYSSKEELLNAHLSNFMPKYQPDGLLSIKKMLQMAKIALENGTNSFEWLYKKTDGELFWAEVVLTKIYLDGEELIHGIWRDISDRKKLEAETEAAVEKQQDQQKVYELIFDNATDGVLILDDGVFTDCNNAIVKMLKYDKKEDLLNVHPSDLSPERQPDGRLSLEKANEMIALAYKNRGHSFEWVHVRATGEEFWAEIVLTPVMINNKEILHVVWRDISQRKELEQVNSSLKERMELAFDGSRDGLWDWDVANDKVYFSPRWKEMLGYRDDELENKFSSWQERVHPEDLEEVMKAIKLNHEGRTETFENKHRLKHKDGHWVWIYKHSLIAMVKRYE
jgi:PAS domain S-box-containing protein